MELLVIDHADEIPVAALDSEAYCTDACWKSTLIIVGVEVR